MDISIMANVEYRDKFPPTAATVSSTLLLGISSLPDTTFNTVFSNKECYGLETPDARITCFVNKISKGCLALISNISFKGETGLLKEVFDLLKSNLPTTNVVYKVEIPERAVWDQYRVWKSHKQREGAACIGLQQGKDVLAL
ncbi:hypothetical protein Tco_1268358 [Tanacetum coccineum]